MPNAPVVGTPENGERSDLFHPAKGLMVWWRCQTVAITLWNTVYIENAINLLKKKGLHINEQLLSHLSPLGWEHINLTGDYIWKNNKKLAEGKYRPLRAVDVSQYKKQP